MLQYMRDKAASWIVIIFLGLIIFVFIFMGFGGGFDKDRTTEVEINGVKITSQSIERQYKNLVEQIRRFNRGFVETEDFQKRFREQAKQQLIQEELIVQEAERLGIDAKADVINYNFTNEAFMKDGKFDLAQYQKILDQQGLDAADYENRLSRYLLQDKIRSLIVGGVKVSDEEILSRYIYDETKVSADYVLFKASDYPDVNYTDKDLSEYLMANKAKYMTKPKVKVEYVVINPSDYINDFKISDNEIKEYYDTNADEFVTPENVAASHILIRTKEDSKPEDIEKAKKKALEIYEKAKKGENFAALAKKYSEGPTAKSGGYLGEFQKGTMVKEFDEKVFSMKEGEISEPVKTIYGWHVIKLDKVNPKRVKPIESAKKDIQAKILKTKIETKAYDIADSIFEGVDKGDSLKDYAKTMKVKFTETDYFTEEDSIKVDPKIRKDFVETSFKLFVDEVSEVKVWDGLFYLIKKVGKKDSEISKLSEIKDRVINDFRATKKEEAALKDAQDFRKSLTDEKSFKEGSKNKNKIVLTVSGVKRNQVIPNIGQNTAISNALFSLGDGRLFTDVLSDVNGYYVFKLNSKEAPPAESMGSKKAEIEQKLSYEKKNQTFAEWIDGLRKKSEITMTR